MIESGSNSIQKKMYNAVLAFLGYTCMIQYKESPSPSVLVSGRTEIDSIPRRRQDKDETTHSRDIVRP